MWLAFAADTVSITAMEIVDNGVVVVVLGAMEAGLGDHLFWGSLALAVAWVAAFRANRWLIARGRGHAVVHQHHGGHDEANLLTSKPVKREAIRSDGELNTLVAPRE